jgi:hypothetical protein
MQPPTTTASGCHTCQRDVTRHARWDDARLRGETRARRVIQRFAGDSGGRPLAGPEGGDRGTFGPARELALEG